MADDQIPPPESGPQPLAPLVQDLVERIFDVRKMSRIERLITNALQSALSTVIGVVLSMAGKIGGFFARTIMDAENYAQGDFNDLAQTAIADMFGVDVGGLNLQRGNGGNVDAANAIGDALLRAFAGQARGAGADDASIEPSDTPAKAFLSAMAQLSLEGWLEGWLVEALSVGQIETFGDLDDTISHVLGLGRASASVHGPLVKTMIVEPLEMKINREHRPARLPLSSVARQWYRGAWDWPDVAEAYAREGHSDENIDALLRDARRYVSAEDVAVLSRRIDPATFDAKQYLRESGYDVADAELHLVAADARVLDAQEKQIADAIIAAYVRRDINVAEYQKLIAALNLPAAEKSHLLRLGDVRLDLNRATLSESDARQAVTKGIRPFAWYRSYLGALGLDDESIFIKEQLLRLELHAGETAEQSKAAAAAARLADKTAADQARAARLAEQAIADALPSLAEVRRAFVRGLVDVARLTDAIAVAHPNIAAADLSSLVADAQLDAAEHVRQLAARDAALQRDRDTALPLATLEQSVLRGISSIDTFDRELLRRKFSADDRAILIALLRGKLADQAAAERARQAAAQRAQLRSISLSDFERAVRLGVRTRDEYAALLAQLQLSDVERRLILDLLDADLQRDRAATAKRADADAAAAGRSINLPLRRRAYVNGLRERDDYLQDLADAGVSADDGFLELQLADLDLEHRTAQRADAGVIETAAAEQEKIAPPRSLTLAQLERAVKLGLLAPDDLRAALYARRYSAGDVELLVASVVADLPALKEAERLQETVDRELRAKGVSLSDLRQAVAKGLLTLDQFGAELGARGYGADAIALLRELLQEQVAIDRDKLQEKIVAAIGAVDGAPTIAELNDAIATRQAADEPIVAYLTAAGVARDLALVYVRLVHSFAPAGAAGDTP